MSETMLWALHNRASEARRPDAVLVDPESISIHAAIDYDFAGHFGDPVGSLAVRAAAIDGVLRRWLEDHPDGFVVSLGEGLETQARRVDNGRMRWLSVDLPAAIQLRARFLPQTDRFSHAALSALDPAWMDAVDASAGVFIVAQGLFMYLEPDCVAELFSAIAGRFPGAEMVFDAVPPWFSRLTLMGLQQTPQYRLPPMPWGISRDDIEPTLRRWHRGIAGVTLLDYGMPRGWPLLFARMVHHIPAIRHEVPSLVHVTMASPQSQPNHASPANADAAAALPSVRDNADDDQNVTTVGTEYMTTIEPNKSTVSTIGSVIAAARSSAGRSNDLTVAAGQVVAKRVALGMAGALRPLESDHAEFARMVPEKVEAFSAANEIMLRHSGQIAREMTRLATQEVLETARATIAMARCANPAALATAQSTFMLAWFNRATTNLLAIGMLSIGAQDAAMGPIRQQVAANVERLAA